jgi:hypothetical protein
MVRVCVCVETGACRRPDQSRAVAEYYLNGVALAVTFQPNFKCFGNNFIIRRS